MKYGVTCLTDDGERVVVRVVVTRKRWDTREEAQAYADTVAESRFAKVHLMCIFCGNGWTSPHCSECGAG
jgi:hypothetical protein